jgi:LPS sulfotransferase NodH
MRCGSILLVALVVATGSACVGVLSHSYSYVTVDRRPTVSETAWTSQFLHLTEPAVENLVVDLTQRLETSCQGRSLINVQSKLTMREFILFQIYSVRLSAGCAQDGPRAGVH